MTLTVFVIDDDLVSQFATRYCLQQFHNELEVIVCGSAEEGLERCAEMMKYERRLPDYIFLDLVMGDMDGWNFIDHLKKNTNKGYTPPKIYVLSSFSNTEDREVAEQHNLISGYFNKPLTRGNLEIVFAKDKVS